MPGSAGLDGIGVRCDPFARVVGAKGDPDARQRGLVAQDAAISGRTSGVDWRVASARLTRNRARASRSRASAISVATRWMRAELADDDADEQQHDALSHSAGSWTVSVYAAG